jgi:hypothetical protein
MSALCSRKDFEMSGYGWLDSRGGRPQQAEGYDVMEVCENGHVTTAYASTMSQFRKPHCPSCGAKTMILCPNCSGLIQGAYNSPGIIAMPPSTPPNNCHLCGAPYPWTVARLAATEELIEDLEDLRAEEKDRLAAAVRDMASDTARTDLGVSRFKKLAAKAGQTVGGSLYKMPVDIASEVAKKALLGR